MPGTHEFQVLSLTGEPFERGRCYGEAKREDIRYFVDYFYQLTGTDKKDGEGLLEKVRSYIPYIQEYSLPLYQELEGMAKGSSCLLEELVMLTLHEELEAFTGSCTSFAVTGKTTRDGTAFQGQTWDIPVELCQKARPFLLVRGGGKDPAIFSFTYSGLLAGAGFNSAGISLSWNSLPRLKIQVGVPTYVIIGEVLRQDTIGGALAAISRAQRAGCFNFVITDEQDIYMVETTPEDLDLFYSTRWLGHANHYQSDKFKHMQSMDTVVKRYAGSSIIRQNRIHRLLEEAGEGINEKDCQSFLLDHVNYPHSICRHPGTECSIPMITCASWVMEPKSRCWWVSNGPPCEGGFLPYSLQEVVESI